MRCYLKFFLKKKPKHYPRKPLSTPGLRFALFQKHFTRKSGAVGAFSSGVRRFRSVSGVSYASQHLVKTRNPPAILGGTDRTIMKTIISIAVLGFLLILSATGDSHAGAGPNAAAQQPDYSQLKADAERAYAQGTYARANELYAKVNKSGAAAGRSALGRFSSGGHLVARPGRD